MVAIITEVNRGVQTMLPGVSGSLISGSYLALVVLPELAARSTASDRRDLLRLQRWWRRAAAALGPASSARAVLDIGILPLVDLLGHDLLHLEPHGDGFAGTLGVRQRPVAAVYCTLWDADPDIAWRHVVRAGRNAGVPWGVICTGPRVRVVDAARTWSRRWIEFDVATALGDERGAAALLGLCRAAAFHGDGPHPAAIDRFATGSDAQARRVCASLGSGVIEALTGLVNAIDSGHTASGQKRHRSSGETFDQALTLVYRLLFLLFAEARGLVPTWHRCYRDAYTIDALDRRLARGRGVRGAWAAFQAISRLAHAGCRAGDLVVTPFNGRLFSPRHTPLGERRRVADALVATAVRALTTHPSPEGRRPVSYADLGVEELGVVYERVLDYEPQRGRGPVVLTPTSTARKSTGSFYTPRSMTGFLVRRTLHPLVADRSADDILALRIVDPAMGSGAFLVAACRHLADAAGLAIDRDDPRPLTPAARRARRAELRRTVAQRCLYGVDLNPMAVQLARLSLWLTTLSADRPLSFLDHHLAVGDSLIGASLADLARRRSGHRPSVRMDTTLPLFDAEAASALAAHVLPARFRLALTPDDTAAAVHDKERTLAALTRPGTALAGWQAAADFWCATWFVREPPSSGVCEDVISALIGRGSQLPAHQRLALVEEAAAEAATRRFFHWELAFPEVFCDPDGRRDPARGFDAVLGNPPWDALRADTGDAADRERRRPDRLARLRFVRESGIYRRQGQGHVNQYQLFLERALAVLRPGGRLGMILPSGLATDQGSAALRRLLLDHTAIERVHGFDNRRGIFPVHRDTRFLLLTATRGESTERLTCAFGLSDPQWLDRLPDRAADDPPEARAVVLTRAFLDGSDPAHVSWPLVPSARDLQVLAQALAAAPPLGGAQGWGVAFGRELNASEDRHHFVDRGTRPDRGDVLLPVIEGKHLEPFRARIDASTQAVSRRIAATLVDAERTFLRPRLAYRDVASATNRVTLIAARLPAGVVSTHTVFCLKTALARPRQTCLLALLNSLVVNYLVRMQVTTHVTTSVMARVPVPCPDERSRVFVELGRLARTLERTGLDDHDAAYASLNALVARLYGLAPDQYAHVVGTFPLLPESLRATCVLAYEQSRSGAVP